MRCSPLTSTCRLIRDETSLVRVIISLQTRARSARLVLWTIIWNPVTVGSELEHRAEILILVVVTVQAIESGVP